MCAILIYFFFHIFLRNFTNTLNEVLNEVLFNIACDCEEADLYIDSRVLSVYIDSALVMTFLDLFIFVPYVYCHKTLTSYKSDEKKPLLFQSANVSHFYWLGCKLIYFIEWTFLYFTFSFIKQTDYIS